MLRHRYDTKIASLHDPRLVQLVAVIQPDAVLELGGGPHSPWMARDKREVLAEVLTHALRLKVGCNEQL